MIEKGLCILTNLILIENDLVDSKLKFVIALNFESFNLSGNLYVSIISVVEQIESLVVRLNEKLSCKKRIKVVKNDIDEKLSLLNKSSKKYL